MSRVAFKQCDVERAIRAAKAEGYQHPTVRFPPEAGFVLLTLPTSPSPAAVAINPWGPVDEANY